MPAITSLEIENFRCFERLRVDGLTQVSLVVGENNTGKTALLEAIEAVFAEDAPFMPVRASIARGELADGAPPDRLEIDIRHWFFGHALEVGGRFELRATGDRNRVLSRTLARGAPEPGSANSSSRQLLLQEKRGGAGTTTYSLNLDGNLVAPSIAALASFGLRLSPPIGFVGTDRITNTPLAKLWSNVVLTPAEDRTIQALRLVEPRIERVAIFESAGTARAQVLLKGASTPVPIGTLGEGTSRLLGLALTLSQTSGGLLLVDEIELGLHWSIMTGVWQFLIETARAFNVQLVATTHSKDCIEAIAELTRSAPDLAEQVSVHRLERGHESTTRLDANRIAEYVRMDLEAR